MRALSRVGTALRRAANWIIGAILGAILLTAGFLLFFFWRVFEDTKRRIFGGE